MLPCCPSCLVSLLTVLPCSHDYLVGLVVLPLQALRAVSSNISESLKGKTSNRSNKESRVDVFYNEIFSLTKMCLFPVLPWCPRWPVYIDTVSALGKVPFDVRLSFCFPCHPLLRFIPKSASKSSHFSFPFILRFISRGKAKKKQQGCYHQRKGYTVVEQTKLAQLIENAFTL